MVHRPADSRLLTNLIKHEKEYSNSLSGTLDLCQQSINALQAYASASSPPASTVIVSVTHFITGAEEAIRKYGVALENWKLQLESLRDMEEEVGIVMRDREILVNRLIKASKTKSQRDLTRPPSPTAPSSRSSGSKLTAAQAELQACESHLATKERELESARVSIVRDGLKNRCHAMLECGNRWNEMGREALNALENFDAVSSHIPSTGARSPFYKPLPKPITGSPNLSISDISSILPSHSASQIVLPDQPIYRSPLGGSKLNLPPPHSISEHSVPVGQQQRGDESDSGSSSDNSTPDGRQVEIHENPLLSSATGRIRKHDHIHFGSTSSRSPKNPFSIRQQQAEDDLKLRKRRSNQKGFLGGIAALFKSRKSKDDSSDDDEVLPHINYDHRTIISNSLRQRTVSLPPTAPSSKTSPRLRRGGLQSKRNTVDDSLLTMRPQASSALDVRSDIGPSSSTPMRKKKKKPAALSALGRIENTPDSPSAASAPPAIETHDVPKRTKRNSTPQRSYTITSNTSSSRRPQSLDVASGRRDSVEGLPRSLRSGLRADQPSLMAVVEGSTSGAGVPRDMWGNEVNSSSSLGLISVKAPGSVLEKINNQTPEKQHSGIVPSSSSIPTIISTSPSTDSAVTQKPKVAPASSPTATPSSVANLSPSSSINRGSPSKMPLKSALRNRSPSPSPLSASRIDQESPSTPTPKANSLAHPQPQPQPSSQPQASSSTVTPPVSSESKTSPADDEDAASIVTSSAEYETGQEDLTDIEEETASTADLHASSVPPPTPSKSPRHQQQQQHQQQQPNGSVAGLHTPEDDLSSNSTTTAPPSRRKSVRMSLQPTFSPTPPALEDEPPETYAPWGYGRIEPPKKDIWQDDSSDEEDEYSQARKRLSKTAKKLASIGKKVASGG